MKGLARSTFSLLFLVTMMTLALPMAITAGNVSAAGAANV